MENEQLAQMRDNWEVTIGGDGGTAPAAEGGGRFTSEPLTLQWPERCCG